MVELPSHLVQFSFSVVLYWLDDIIRQTSYVNLKVVKLHLEIHNSSQTLVCHTAPNLTNNVFTLIVK